MKAIHIPINEIVSLTEVRSTDIANIAKHINDEEIFNNTLLIPHPYYEKDALEFVGYVQKAEAENQFQNHWAIRKADGEFIGGIGIHYNYGNDSHKSQIGYWLGRAYWRQGIMTACVAAFTEYCFANTDLIRLEATVFAHNTGSIKILERLGYEREGILRKAYKKRSSYHDGILYAKVK